MAAADPAPEVNEVLAEMPAWVARGLLYTIVTFVVAVLVWAHFSVVDVVVSGRGKMENGKVEATVRNQDIGLIDTGFPAQLKIDAYPFQKFGVVPATVTAIERSGSDYKVTLEPQQAAIPVHGRHRRLRDGLSLTADIVTDRQTLLSMLLRPFQKPESAK